MQPGGHISMPSDDHIDTDDDVWAMVHWRMTVVWHLLSMGKRQLTNAAVISVAFPGRSRHGDANLTFAAIVIK